MNAHIRNIIRVITVLMGDPTVTELGKTTAWTFTNPAGVKLAILAVDNGAFRAITSQGVYTDFARCEAGADIETVHATQAKILRRARWLMGIELAD